ncbi:MAG: tetratricopeptide repeat protein [Deltaproteobacteria bacterium]|nr:tetratricopeptide repeat protein [Deltaproteobacteria bacterium]
MIRARLSEIRVRNAGNTLSNLTSRKMLFLFLLLFAFALLVRTIYFVEFQENPFFEYVHPSHDSLNVHNGALEISAGNILLDKKGFKYPFYSYFVAGIYSLTHHTVYGVWIFQFILGALAASLLFLIGTNLFNRTVGIICSLFYALYGPNLFYEGIMLRAALTEFLAVLSFYFLIRLEKKISYGNLLLGGASLSLMIQCRANTVVLLPFVLFYLYFGTLGKKSFKFRLKYFSAFVLALALVGTPLLLRGVYVEKRFHFYDPGGPHVFLMGNLVDYDGLGWHNGSPRYKEYQQRYGEKLLYDYKLVLKQVLKEISDSPIAFLGLYMRKAYYFFCNYEIPSNNNFYIYQKFSYLLRNPLGSFSLVVSLAFLGLIVSFKDYRRHLLLYIFLLGMTGSTLIFYNVSRLRMPAVPFYLLFSSAGIYSLFQFIKAKQLMNFIIAVLMIIALIICLNIRDVQKIRENDYGMLGDAYFAEGMHDESIFQFKKSLAIKPQNALAHYNIGISFSKKGNHADAIRHFYEASRIAPRFVAAHNNLGLMLCEQSRFSDAIRHFSDALQIEPENVNIQNNLGIAYARQGNLKNAAVHFAEAVRLSPQNKAIRINLDRCLKLLGRADVPLRK